MDKISYAMLIGSYEVLLFVCNRLGFSLASVCACALLVFQFGTGYHASKFHLAYLNIAQGAQSASPSQAVSDVDTSHWTVLTNKYGWKIKYPPQIWQTDRDAAASGLVEFSAGDCTKERCASFQSDSEIFQKVNGDDKKSPQDFLTAGKQPKLGYMERAFEIGGFPAFEVSGPNVPAPALQIAVKHYGKILLITYVEGGKDVAAIKSSADWKYANEFWKILSTSSFYNVPESAWPRS